MGQFTEVVIIGLIIQCVRIILGVLDCVGLSVVCTFGTCYPLAIRLIMYRVMHTSHRNMYL